MTMNEVYRLAHRQAVDQWFKEDEAYQRTKSNLYKARADKAWEKVKELEEWGYENGLTWGE